MTWTVGYRMERLAGCLRTCRVRRVLTKVQVDMVRFRMLVVLCGLFASSCALAGPDHFADDLVIPDDLELEYPAELVRGEPTEWSAEEEERLWAIAEEESRDWIPTPPWEPGYKPPAIAHRVLDVNDFVLYEAIGPSRYDYDVWHIGAEGGSVWLSATEVTTGAELSVDYLRERTLLEVSASPGVATRHESERDLKVYEGDIGKPYAANFQLWFQAEGSDVAALLVEKVYVIEGWQH